MKSGDAFAVFHILIKVIFIPPQKHYVQNIRVLWVGVQSGRWKGLLEQVTLGVYDD